MPMMWTNPELYNLELDPDESYNVAADIQARILKLLPAFPPDVMNAWNLTMSQKSTGVDGSLPTRVVPQP